MGCGEISLSVPAINRNQRVFLKIFNFSPKISAVSEDLDNSLSSSLDFEARQCVDCVWYQKLQILQSRNLKKKSDSFVLALVISLNHIIEELQINLFFFFGPL